MDLGARQVIFRELTLGEWGRIGELGAGYFSLYSTITRCAILEPAYADLLPGEILYVGEIIFDKSAKFSDDKYIEGEVSRIRSGLEESIDIIPALVCSAFPSYTPEMVMEFDFQTLMIRLAQIQWMDDQNRPRSEIPGLNPLQKMGVDSSRQNLATALRRGRKG